MNNFTDQKAEAYDFIAWLNSPAVSLDAVFGGVERWQPFRRSHTEAFDDGVGPPGQGLSPGAVEDYLQVGRHAADTPLSHPVTRPAATLTLAPAAMMSCLWGHLSVSETP